MTDNIKLPEFPCVQVPRIDADIDLLDIGRLARWCRQVARDYARETVRLNAQAAPEPIPLNIIRKWPEGFEARLQHVWLDVVSFIPSVKLYDLQRVLAEFGLRMEVYEDAPAAPQPAVPVKRKRRYAQGTALGEFGIIPMCDQVDDEPVNAPHATTYCQHPHCQTTGGCQGPCSKKQAGPVKVPSDDLAHEIWAAAQTAPGEGIEDAVERVAALLTRRVHHDVLPWDSAKRG